jgi:hypothetical protein
MAVLRNWIGKIRIGIWVDSDCSVGPIEQKGPFLPVPAIVLSRNADVDLFDIILSDVADDQSIRVGIKAKAERISQPPDKDLTDRIRLKDKRVRARDPVFPVGANWIRASGR